MLDLAVDLRAFVHAGEMAQSHAGAAHFLIHVEHQRIVPLEAFAMRAAGDELARERTCFETAIVDMRDRRRPGIFACMVQGYYWRSAFVVRSKGCTGSVALVVPGMHRILAREPLLHELMGVGSHRHRRRFS